MTIWVILMIFYEMVYSKKCSRTAESVTERHSRLGPWILPELEYGGLSELTKTRGPGRAGDTGTAQLAQWTLTVTVT